MSYLRIRSAASTTDPHGVIIRRIKAVISDPKAPTVTRDEQEAYQRDYMKSIVLRW